MPDDILMSLYPPDQIFITNYAFDDSCRGIAVTCLVPFGTQYTTNPIPYVTAENYVRCLSQACYLLAEHVLERRLLPVDMGVVAFRTAAVRWEIFYRNLCMTFHHRVNKGVSFQMRFTLKNWREIKRMEDFLLFTFTNERTVISGEMSFVFKG